MAKKYYMVLLIDVQDNNKNIAEYFHCEFAFTQKVFHFSPTQYFEAFKWLDSIF